MTTRTERTDSGWLRHWRILRDSWALETERLRSRKTWSETDFLPAALENAIDQTAPQIDPGSGRSAWRVPRFRKHLDLRHRGRQPICGMRATRRMDAVSSSICNQGRR